MMWFSRLLPQASGPARGPRRGFRSVARRRRTVTLEILERRVVLSNVSASYWGGVLTIVSNVGSNPPLGVNAFSIAEASAAAGGKVTVSPVVPFTTVNGSGGPFTTPGAVTAIKVTIVGLNPSIAETVNLSGAGKTTPTTVKTVDFSVSKAKLSLNASGVDNSGAFTLNTTGGLKASIDGSTFSAITINQTGTACCASVSLTDDDTNNGAVKVTEAAANGASINLVGDEFGSTTLIQGDGDGDSVVVYTTTVRDMSIVQGGGDKDAIEVEHLWVAPVGKGLTTIQGDGDGDSTIVSDVNLAVGAPVKGPLSPSTAPGVKVIQGDGDGDDAEVLFATLPGNVAIVQGDGDGDYAEVSFSTLPGDVTIIQGDGDGDYALAYSDTVGVQYLGQLLYGTVSITQGDGLRDGARAVVIANQLAITQGDGDEDSVLVEFSNVHGSVTIVQGDGGDTDDGDSAGDVVRIELVFGLAGVMSITQGDGDGDFAFVQGSFFAIDAAGGFFVVQGDGDGDYVSMYWIVSSAGGVAVVQGDGDRDYASLITITAALDVSVVQGDGDGDSATIGQVDVGDVFIVQGDGNADNASIVGVTDASGDVWIRQGDGHGDSANFANITLVDGDVWVTQGDGDGDIAVIYSASTGSGDVSVVQGDGGQDIAVVVAVTAGVMIPAGPFVIDFGGTVTIVQGDGYADLANVFSATVNNIVVRQGDNVYDPSCDPGLYKTVTIDLSTVTSDITIAQGDAASTGGYTAIIGENYGATAGGITAITQNGVGNYLNFGGVDSYFETNFLDAYTGRGFALVVATNTAVYFGSWLGNDATITGDGDDNTYYDGGGNTGVIVSDDFNLS